MTQSRGIGRGGRRAGAGAPTFVPTDEQRVVVKLLIGSGRPHEEVVTAIKNPHTGKPISVTTLHKAFAEEIAVGQVEMNALAMTGLAGQLKKGNMTAIIWWTKNRMDWKDNAALEVAGKGGAPLVFKISDDDAKV